MAIAEVNYKELLFYGFSLIPVLHISIFIYWMFINASNTIFNIFRYTNG